MLNVRSHSSRLLVTILPPGAVEVKGLPVPVPAWQVLRPSVVESRFEALRGSALTPLIGRDKEIDLLLRRWERTRFVVFGGFQPEHNEDYSRTSSLPGREQCP